MLKDDDKKENIKGVQAVEKNTEKKKYSRLGPLSPFLLDRVPEVPGKATGQEKK